MASKTIICERCGEETPRTSYYQKYCPTCARHMRNAYNRACEEERELRQRMQERQKACEERRRAFAAINEQARKAKTSYGKYTAAERCLESL